MTLRWALLTPWKPFNVMWHETKPLLFRTRREARQWASHHYGYVCTRTDLRMKPFEWRMPKPVMVDVKLEVL